MNVMNTVPEHQRVYKSCVYPVACIIVVMYVDNNGVWHNCWELLAEFEADVAKDWRIDLWKIYAKSWSHGITPEGRTNI